MPVKKKTWIRIDLLQKLVPMVIDQPRLRELMMLFLASYIFLLRLPSEGIPLAAHEAPAGREAPVISIADDKVVIDFPFRCDRLLDTRVGSMGCRGRKNRLVPTRQTRTCWCRSCKVTCPVHILGVYIRAQPAGTQPFEHIKPCQALLALRELLLELGVPDALSYGTHGLRRGHAEDIARIGGRLADILAAGDWKSGPQSQSFLAVSAHMRLMHLTGAFLEYMDKER